MYDLIHWIEERDLTLHVAVQLTPEELARMWLEMSKSWHDYFNVFAGRNRDAGIPTLEEIVSAAERGPTLSAVTLWQSYIGKGAPSNRSGSRTGFGSTRAAASKAAAHWNNQASHEKFRRVTLFDWSGVSASPQAPQEQIAAGIFGWLDMAPTLTRVEETALFHYRKLRYASAWLALYPPSVLTATQ
jgi:hypothetical protein